MTIYRGAAFYPVYLSYTDGVQPFFQVLDGTAGKAATVLHNRSVLGETGEPPIEVVCITNGPVARPQAEAVSQAAIDFAMETGLLPMKANAPDDNSQNEPKGGHGFGFSPN